MCCDSFNAGIYYLGRRNCCRNNSLRTLVDQLRWWKRNLRPYSMYCKYLLICGLVHLNPCFLALRAQHWSYNEKAKATGAKEKGKRTWWSDKGSYVWWISLRGESWGLTRFVKINWIQRPLYWQPYCFTNLKEWNSGA